MTAWNESVKIQVGTENEDAEVEFDTDSEGFTYLYLKKLPMDGKERPRELICTMQTVDLTRLAARMVELWSEEAELQKAAEEAPEEETKQ